MLLVASQKGSTGSALSPYLALPLLPRKKRTGNPVLFEFRIRRLNYAAAFAASRKLFTLS
jgi:hypothetical protein